MSQLNHGGLRQLNHKHAHEAQQHQPVLHLRWHSLGRPEHQNQTCELRWGSMAMHGAVR